MSEDFTPKQNEAVEQNDSFDRRMFVLPSDKWEEFLAALDAPAQSNNNLRDLLIETDKKLKNPQHVQVISSELVNRIQSLVADVELDLDAPLSDEDE